MNTVRLEEGAQDLEGAQELSILIIALVVSEAMNSVLELYLPGSNLRRSVVDGEHKSFQDFDTGAPKLLGALHIEL